MQEFPPIARMQDRNLVGLCHLDVVEVGQVATMPDELDGNIVDAITLMAGATWSRVYLDDNGGLLSEKWQMQNGALYSTARCSGVIAKDRLALMPKLWKMKGRRYLVNFTTRNGDQLLMGTKNAPAIALVQTRTAGDSIESDRNQYDISFELTRRLPVPFYQGTIPESTGCPTLAELLAAATLEQILDGLSNDQEAAILAELGDCPTLEELIAAASTSTILTALSDAQEEALLEALGEYADALVDPVYATTDVLIDPL